MLPSGTFLVGSNPTTTTDKVITIVQLVYGIPSVMVMTFLLFFLGFGKSYKNSFYRLVQMDLLTNLLCYLNSWLILRIQQHPSGVKFLITLEKIFPGLLTLQVTLLIFFMHMQFLSAAALNIHRITSVVFITSYDKYWSRWYPLFGVFCIGYSSLPILSVTGRPFDVKVVNDSVIGSWYQEVIEVTLVQTAIFVLLYFVALLVIGVSTYVMVSRKIKTFTDNDRGVSKKLTKIAMTYCSIYIGILLWCILGALNEVLHFLPDFIYPIRGYLLMFASDLITLALPWILLLNDTNVQRDLKSFLWTPMEVDPGMVSASIT